MTFIPFLFGATPQAGTQSSTGGSIASIVMFVLLIAIFYFFLIRPQNKKQKETQKMLDALKKGDKIVTIGGIHGTVFSLKDSSVVVKVDDNTKIEFSRSAIAGLENPPEVSKDKKSTENSNEKKSAERSAEKK